MANTKIEFKFNPLNLFMMLIQVLFIGLKLTDQITWSWWWVLAPLWSPFALYLLGTGLVLLGEWGERRLRR